MRAWRASRRIWSRAVEVWKEPEAARDFLTRPHPMIDDRPPLDVVIRSEFGGELVMEILGRLQYGSAA